MIRGWRRWLAVVVCVWAVTGCVWEGFGQPEDANGPDSYSNTVVLVGERDPQIYDGLRVVMDPADLPAGFVERHLADDGQLKPLLSSLGERVSIEFTLEDLGVDDVPREYCFEHAILVQSADGSVLYETIPAGTCLQNGEYTEVAADK